MCVDNKVVRFSKGEEHKVFDYMEQRRAELTVRLSRTEDQNAVDADSSSSDEDDLSSGEGGKHSDSGSDDTYDYETFAHLKGGQDLYKKSSALTRKQAVANKARVSAAKKDKEVEKKKIRKIVNFEKHPSVEPDDDIDKPEKMTLRLATYVCKKYKRYVDSFEGDFVFESEEEEQNKAGMRKKCLEKFFHVLSRRVYKLEDLEMVLDVMKGMGVTLSFMERRVKDSYPLDLDMRDVLRFVMCNSKTLSDSLIRDIMTALFPVNLQKEMESILEKLVTFDKGLKGGMEKGMQGLTFQDSIKDSEMFRNFMGNYEKMSDRETNDFCPLKPNEILFLELKAMFGEHVNHMITRRPQLTRKHKWDLKSKLHGLPKCIEMMEEESDRVKANLLKEMLARMIKHSQLVEKYDRGDYHYKCLNHFYDNLVEATERLSVYTDSDEDDDDYQNYKVQMLPSTGDKLTIAELLSEEEKLRMLT